MKKYIFFTVLCKSKRSAYKLAMREFRDTCKRYLSLDESQMQMYWIPEGTKEYIYAHEMSEKYPKPENWDSYDSNIFFVAEGEGNDYIIRYSKEDFDAAVAYIVNFWYFADTYEDIPLAEPLFECCDKPSWKYVTGMIQKTNYRIPPKEFKTKKYAKLLPGYAVSKEVVDLLLAENAATMNDFLEVYDKSRKKIVSYQFAPENIFTGFAKDNNMILQDKCDNCGAENYTDIDAPYYISESTLSQLKCVNVTKEYSGPIIEEKEKENAKPDERCSYLEPWIIVDKRTYTILHEKYPRMQFIPVFKK